PKNTKIEDIFGPPGEPDMSPSTTVAPAGQEGEGEASSPSPEPPREAGEQTSEPLVSLDPAAYDDLLPVKGSFSDDPPADWTDDDDPVTAQLDPVAAARKSLLEDAARARNVAPAASANVAVPVQRRGSRIPEIRQALSRAARVSAGTRYRSRI